jgi:multiple sugar transport system permease protein
MIGSLFVAILLNQKLAATTVWRTLYFLPTLTPLVAAALLWRWMLNPDVGLVNYLLSKVGIEGPGWLNSTTWAIPSLVIMGLWASVGGSRMIIFLAGLQSIPEDLYEAARIDGANTWKQFRHVTVPMLGPVLLLVSILTMAGYFQLFAEPYVMTQGGPLESTKSVLYLMYEEGFKWWNLGNASAVAFLLFVLMVATTSGLLWFARRKGIE